MSDIDLDFDDDLAQDAKAFGQQIAQGDADQLSLPKSEEPSGPKPTSLEGALCVAREVYGETNSIHSEVFCQWVQVVLEGEVDIRAAEEMLAMLHSDKESFGGRAAWKQYEGGVTGKVVHLRARRQAAICAMNVVHAVLNKARGRGYMLWVERSLWRATRAEKDVKSER